VEGISDTGQQVGSHTETAEKLPQILKDFSVILVKFKGRNEKKVNSVGLLAVRVMTRYQSAIKSSQQDTGIALHNSLVSRNSVFNKSF
jgi:hypothetical protein